MPVEITVVDGRPRPSDADPFGVLGLPEHPQFDLNSTYMEAIFEVNSTDENGSILDLRIISGGAGYEPSFIDFFTGLPVSISGLPRVIISGGGGMGAEVYGIVEDNGSISGVYIAEGGLGYYNFNSNNYPKFSITPNPARPIEATEKNATLFMSLGGSLKEPTANNNTGSFSLFDGFANLADTDAKFEEFRYVAPWVMILDKGRTEASIPASERAHAVARVVDGNITKIIVTEGGTGYVDPHVIICGTPPNYSNLNDGKSYNAWQWRCTNLRETTSGTFLTCGHVDSKNYPYPPETCPGEDVGEGVFRTSTNWDKAFDSWQANHSKTSNHPNCPDASNHRVNQFLSPICSGKKANYVLINDLYRAGRSGSYEEWINFETNCTATAVGGQIREIKIRDFGTKYLAPEIAIFGSGGSTDPIPVFDEQGIINRIFYNDLRIKSLEFDKFPRPIGAGQGFSSKPWGKDDKYRPAFGGDGSVRCIIYSDVLYWDPPGPAGEYEVYDFSLSLGKGLEVVGSYGDRISNIQVLEPGLYNTPDLNVTVDYNGSIIPDLDLDGFPDFRQGTAKLQTTNLLISLELDSNGTYEETAFQLEPGRKLDLWRSTFLAEPNVQIFNELNGVTLSNYNAESSLSEIRLNGIVEYDPTTNKSYLDIVADDRLPNKFYYGLGGSNRSGMGGEIFVYDGMPGLNWGQENNWDDFAFTDENGTYVIPNLDPGMYNIAVLMEDENFQDLALRPDSNPTLYSRTLYVPGFNPILLETDNRGNGRSRLVWGQDARDLSRLTIGGNPLKVVEGIGGGFETSKKYNFNIAPYATNTTQGKPNIDYEILSDGALRFTIIDDADSSIFDPNDRFTISFSSVISGIDFTNTVGDGIINNSFWAGNKAARDTFTENNKTLVLSLSPQSGDTVNSIEVPVRCESDNNASQKFTLTAFDENGSMVDCSDVIWDLSFPDLNLTKTDGNLSKIASFETPQYYMLGEGGNGYGYYYPLYPKSVYLDSDSNGTGIYNPLNASSSSLYHTHTFAGTSFYMPTGNVNHATIALPAKTSMLNGRFDYNESSQVNLILNSTLQGKGMTLTATLNGESISTRIIMSKQSVLTEEELWLDQHFSTILKSSISALDEDNDTLTLAQEWNSRTNPLASDTDADGLADDYEINISKTNPRSSDTDGDGFSDNTELTLAGLDPLVYNTAPPLPIITALNTGGSILTITAGNKIILGAEATETSLTGQSSKLVVSMEGNFSQVISLVNQEWVVNNSAPSGSFEVTYRAIDSLKRNVELVQTIIVTAIDLIPPTISLTNNGPLYILKGSSFTLPNFTAFDNQDGSLTSSVSVAGESMVDVNKTGTYQVNYSVSDAAGNTANTTLNVVVEDFAYTLNGKAIDGYLSGSTVIFDGKADTEGFDGLHDLNRTILTDASGSFTLQLTSSELNTFDLNGNNLLDANEGRIIITGGYDPTIDANFTGRYQTDANSSVVSPLSSLVTAVMDQGLSKEQAKSKVATAFGLSSDIDPTNYDPIAAALAGEASSSQFLLATARLANAMKQADALAGYLSIPTTSAGQVSTAFVAQLAQSLSNSLINSNPLDDSTVLTQAFSASLQSVQSSADVSQVSSAVTLLESADNLLVQTISAGGTPNILAVSLAKNQQAVEDAIIEGYSNPSITLSTLATTATTASIQSASNAISSINVFPPVAQDFQSSIRADKWTSGSLLMAITASDGDGDSIIYSITTANFDLDADGNKPFAVSSSGALSINDIDDLLPYAGSTVDIKLSLSDGKGMSTSILGALSIDNKLSLNSTPIDGKPGWVESSWLKTFYSAGALWIYHPAHDWLYISTDNSDGYWFWDSKMKIWWWTKPSIYPYFYRSNGIWNYWHFNGTSRVYFNYQTNTWVTP